MSFTGLPIQHPPLCLGVKECHGPTHFIDQKCEFFGPSIPSCFGFEPVHPVNFNNPLAPGSASAMRAYIAYIQPSLQPLLRPASRPWSKTMPRMNLAALLRRDLFGRL